MATVDEGCSKVGGRGVGKFQKRRPQTTAYDGPSNAARNPSYGWLSKVVDPASRLSKRLFQYAFGKRLPKPEPELPPSAEVNEEPRDQLQETVIPLQKRRRDSEIESDGPIRRIRQKPDLQTRVHEDYVEPVGLASQPSSTFDTVVPLQELPEPRLPPLPDLNEEPNVSASTSTTSTTRGQLVGYHPSLSNNLFNSTDNHDQMNMEASVAEDIGQQALVQLAVTSPSNMFGLASTSTAEGQILGANISNQSGSNSFPSVGNASTPATGSTASHSSSGSVSIAAPPSFSAPSSRMLCGSYNYDFSSSGNFSFGFL